VVKAGGSLGLASKPGEVGWAGEITTEQHLHRHGPAEAQLHGPVDDAHAAATDLLFEFVVTKQGGQRRGPGHERSWPRHRGGRAGRSHWQSRPRIIALPEPRGHAGRQHDRRLFGHRVGHRHRREQLAELASEVGVLGNHGVESPLGF
jgi:hypothetical protein